MPWFSFLFTHHGITTKSNYHLHRYLLRSMLTFIGPLMVLGFYVYICLSYLVQPPLNDFVSSDGIDGNWIFYAWFVISVLMIDWARTGLANIEACALMDPRFAPSAATKLMWHTDANWSNPIWWFKAIFTLVPPYRVKGMANKTSSVRSMPGGLWMALSLAMVFLIAAVPLSGLSMQTAQVFTRSSMQAPIYGPQRTSFGKSGGTQSDSVRMVWQVGRQTSPQRGGFLYAPMGSDHVSETYFDDMAARNATNIETFAGPAVREPVVGRAWGMWSNISCQPVTPGNLQLIHSTRYDDFSLNVCKTQNVSSCDFEWTSTANASKISSAGIEIVLPLWMIEAGNHGDDLTNYSLVAAADGYNGRPTLISMNRASQLKSPYFVNDNHDNVTIDHFRNGATDNTTTAVFEVYIWQSRQGHDALMQSWIDSASDVISLATEKNGFLGLIGAGKGDRPWAGFGVHCDVKSATGFADVDPGRRQFSNFVMSPAVMLANDTNLSPLTSAAYPSVLPIQVQAVWSMSALVATGTKQLQAHDPNSDQSIWAVIQQSINARKFDFKILPGKSNTTVSVRPLISPGDLQRSMYKLLGENIIALMDESGNNSWLDRLYIMRQATYIIPGPMPWQYVLALLTVWALLMSGGALWTIVSGPRWAPTLNGFEMFKFGAQYGSEMNELTHVDFRKCIAPLDRIPGAVGLLHGHRPTSAAAMTQMQNQGQGYFIGLSENTVGSALRNTTTTFTFDRRKANVARY